MMRNLQAFLCSDTLLLYRAVVADNDGCDEHDFYFALPRSCSLGFAKSYVHDFLTSAWHLVSVNVVDASFLMQEKAGIFEYTV